ncbi:MAG: hypothetical protein ED555_05790 [Allomuricauda sp.]|nr:MAG: hypothetical protein ED555_05790 [Allomuricauda sp.]
MDRGYLLLCILVLWVVSCETESDKLFLERHATETGIDFNNRLTETPELNILNYLYYYNGGGVVTADFNNDNLVDIYFTGNQVGDELYLNLGGMKFKKITQQAGLDNKDGWTTGVTHADINADGLLDIYVCKASGYRNLKGHNKLYINKGIDADGIPHFEEQAEQFGLDFSGLSTQAAFFDYDLDGDLDMFLLNHSVHPNRNYGRGKLREITNDLSGDQLLENVEGIFQDVSTQAGIFQGRIGYGLGLGVSDINDDGFPDIYIGNDFFENDYLYINQGDGTFKEIISQDDKKLGHTTHYSMGNDLADINNDGLIDLVSLDMLPEDLKTYKTSGLEYAYPIYRQYLKNGYAPQYMQNTLHLNLGNTNFSEIANLVGLDATEWSWSALMADFDNDGFRDIFISNGIKGATNDMDYMNFIANEDIQKRIDAGMQQTDMPLVNEIPEKKVTNYIYRNNGDLTFSDKTDTWFNSKPSFSNGSAYADLDNDGDLDIVVNNIDEEAYIFENTSSSGNYLQIDLQGEGLNLNGIGSKIKAFVKDGVRSAENFPTRGYLSAIDKTIHLGIGHDSIVDSLHVIWPSGAIQVIKGLAANQRIKLFEKDAKDSITYEKNWAPSHFIQTDSLIEFKHRETVSLDFDREPLIPFANSNQGPSIAIGDVNLDGLDDFFITGAKNQASGLFIQDHEGAFNSIQSELFAKHSLHEDVASCFFDANGDGSLDLIVGSGGNEFAKGKPLQPRLYLNQKGTLVAPTNTFFDLEANISKISSVDLENDGDLDLLLTSDQVTSQFGQTPRQYLLQNDGQGNFKDVTEAWSSTLLDYGNIKDFIWVDIDGNGFKDLIVVGHWMPVSIFLNDGKHLQLTKYKGLEYTHGWWNAIKAADIDNDGDTDLICGNWGLNSKFRASYAQPITLYRKDFDENGSIDPVVTYYHKNAETPFASKDELVKQMPFLNKKFLSYANFADASIDELFGRSLLEKASKKNVYELNSCYFVNNGNGSFTKKKLPHVAQFSSIHDLAFIDSNEDEFKDVLIVGNNFEISTQLGRLDAFHGVILQNDTEGGFVWKNDKQINVTGAARTIGQIQISGQNSFIIGRNNDTPIILRKN